MGSHSSAPRLCGAGTPGCSEPVSECRPSIIDACCFQVPFSVYIIYRQLAWKDSATWKKKKAPRAKCLRSCLQQHSQGRMGPSRAFPDTYLEQEQEMAKKLHLNIEKSHPGTGKKLENGTQALCDWPSHSLVGAGGSCRMGRVGEDHAAITQSPCRGWEHPWVPQAPSTSPRGFNSLLTATEPALCSLPAKVLLAVKQEA